MVFFLSTQSFVLKKDSSLTEEKREKECKKEKEEGKGRTVFTSKKNNFFSEVLRESSLIFLL